KKHFSEKILPGFDLKEGMRKHPEGMTVSTGATMAGFWLRFAGVDYPIAQVTYKANIFWSGGSANTEFVEIKGEGVSKQMQHASGEILGKKWDVLFPEGRQSKRIVVDFPV